MIKQNTLAAVLVCLLAGCVGQNPAPSVTTVHLSSGETFNLTINNNNQNINSNSNQNSNSNTNQNSNSNSNQNSNGASSPAPTGAPAAPPSGGAFSGSAPAPGARFGSLSMLRNYVVLADRQ